MAPIRLIRPWRPRPGSRRTSPRGRDRSAPGSSPRWRWRRPARASSTRSTARRRHAVRARSVTRAVAVKAPRSLKMRTVSPVAMRRAAASSGWMSSLGRLFLVDEAGQVGERRVQEIARRRRHERERIARGQFRIGRHRFARRHERRQRIVALRRERGGNEFALAGWRREVALRERRVDVGDGETLEALRLQHVPVESRGARMRRCSTPAARGRRRCRGSRARRSPSARRAAGRPRCSASPRRAARSPHCWRAHTGDRTELWMSVCSS